MGSSEENRLLIQGSNATEKVTGQRFLELPLIVIPNLFRDLFFAKSGTDIRRLVSPYFRSRPLVSAANVSNVIFLGCSKPSASSGSQDLDAETSSA